MLRRRENETIIDRRAIHSVVASSQFDCPLGQKDSPSQGMCATGQLLVVDSPRNSSLLSGGRRVDRPMGPHGRDAPESRRLRATEMGTSTASRQDASMPAVPYCLAL